MDNEENTDLREVELRLRLKMPEILEMIEENDRAYEDSRPSQAFLRDTYFVV